MSPVLRTRPVLCWLLCAGLWISAAARAEVTTGVDKETGLKSWTWHGDGVSLQLAQRLPDQTRAFFLGRGFPAQAADVIGRACVFQTIFRNDGSKPMSYDLGDWVVHYRDRTMPVLVRHAWESRWQAMGIDQSARIAFRWSLLPTRQRFEPGDYNWGMTSYGLEPGEHFDLALTVDLGGQPVTARMQSIECARDI